MKRSRFLFSAAAALVTVLLTIGATAIAASAAGDHKPRTTALERVSAYATPSVVHLQMQWSGTLYDAPNKQCIRDITGNASKCKGFTITEQCTGFVVSPDGYIATAGHCMNPGDTLSDFYQAAADWVFQCGCYYQDTTLTHDRLSSLAGQDYVVRHYDSDVLKDVRGPVRGPIEVAYATSVNGTSTPKTVPATFVASQPTDATDGALVKADTDDLIVMPLSRSDLAIGRKVVSVGFPAAVSQVTDGDLTASFKDGSVSSKKTTASGLATVYETSAALSGGMSGGPTVGLDGSVLGVNDFTNGGETQAFNFIQSTSGIRDLLAGAGGKNDLTGVSQRFRDGLDAYFAGDRSTAVSRLSAVVKDQPTNATAVDYLARAKKLKGAAVPGGEGGLVAVLLGLVVVTLLVAGAVVVIVVRRRAGGTTAPVAVPTSPTPESQPAEASDSESDLSVFCGSCGTRSEAEGQRYCRRCGATL